MGFTHAAGLVPRVRATALPAPWLSGRNRGASRGSRFVCPFTAMVRQAMFSLLRCLFDFKASLTLSKLYVGVMGIGRWEIGDSAFHAHPEFQGAGQETGTSNHATLNRAVFHLLPCRFLLPTHHADRVQWQVQLVGPRGQECATSIRQVLCGSLCSSLPHPVNERTSVSDNACITGFSPHLARGVQRQRRRRRAFRAP